jgi:hypothetical protein
VSAVDVRIRPRSGRPGHKLRIRARGFTTGRRLYAHVRGKIDRNVRIGRLKRRCRKLGERRRIFPASTPTGTYVVQFDTNRRYRRSRKVKVRFRVDVVPIFGSSPATGQTWRRID